MSVEVAWRVIQDSYMGSIRKFKKWCTAHDINVVERAALSHISNATLNCDIIAIVAHWKDHRYRATDILANCSEIKLALASQHDTEWMADTMETSPINESEESIARYLNHQIEMFDQWLALEFYGAENIVTTQQYTYCKARERLDKVLDGLVVPGARLELHDSLHTAESIAACFDHLWSGTCDFACCHSNYLSETTKARAPEALFRIDERPLNPNRVISYLDDTFRLMCRKSLPYARASSIIRDQRS